MNRFILAFTLALATGAAAMAQAVSAGTTSTTTTSSGTESTGIAKPPAGAPPGPQPVHVDHSANASVLGNNTPTTPQIGLHPEATIGTPVPIAGPGGTTRNATGN